MRKLTKIRPDDRLSNLQPDDRARLDSWLKSLSYREVLRLAALPRPEGIDLKTSSRALSVYYHKYLGPSPLDDLNRVIQANPKAADQAAQSFLQTKALELATGKLTLSAFNALARYQFRLKNHELAERKQQLHALESFLGTATQTQ